MTQVHEKWKKEEQKSIRLISVLIWETSFELVISTLDFPESFKAFRYAAAMSAPRANTPH